MWYWVKIVIFNSKQVLYILDTFFTPLFFCLTCLSSSKTNWFGRVLQKISYSRSKKKRFLFRHDVAKLPELRSLINLSPSLRMTITNCVILDKPAHFLLSYYPLFWQIWLVMRRQRNPWNSYLFRMKFLYQPVFYSLVYIS